MPLICFMHFNVDILSVTLDTDETSLGEILIYYICGWIIFLKSTLFLFTSSVFVIFNRCLVWSHFWTFNMQLKQN